jgi:hypothetical protein
LRFRLRSGPVDIEALPEGGAMTETQEAPQAPRRRGRRLKLTEELIAQLEKDISISVPVRIAAQRAGIGESTYYRWHERAERARSGVFREFRERIARAEANLMTLHLLKVNQAANDGDWRASVWMLARRFPDVFGTKVELGGPVKVKSPVHKLKTIINLVPTDSDDRPTDAPNHPASAANGQGAGAERGA